MDDLIIGVKNQNAYVRFTTELDKVYKVKHEESLTWILGIELKNNGLNQGLYLEKCLSKFGMQDCKTADVPMSVGQNLYDDTIGNLDSNFPYREAIGSLLYLSRATRPDISTAVSICSRFVENPRQQHVQAVKRIFRYLKETREFALKIKTTKEGVKAYVDSDWGGDQKDRKSTSGIIIFYGGCPVMWSSKKQKCVALSTAEAEYVALAKCIQDVKWISAVLKELGEKLETPVIWEDNQACITIASSNGSRQGTKHIEMRYHFVKDAIKNEEVCLKYIKSEDQVADIMTKPIGRIGLARFRPALFSGAFGNQSKSA